MSASWLPKWVSKIFSAGSELTQRDGLNFVSGVTLTDNAAFNRIDATVAGDGNATALDGKALGNLNTNENWLLGWDPNSGTQGEWIPMRGVVVVDAGEITANEATPVATACASFAAGDFVIFTIKTPHTPGAVPALVSTTAGVGFSSVCDVNDVSVYYYAVLRLGTINA
jgi:hypothetical protein